MKDVVIICQPASAKVRGDRRSLARLLRSVLENAVSFSPRGSHVRVESSLEDDRVVLTVEDDGPGIAAGDEERVFEPFARAAARADGAEGTGLGLSIARGLARAFGGDVTAKHGPGGRLLVALPRA
jgi:signal transduction histidine kinase